VLTVLILSYYNNNYRKVYNNNNNNNNNNKMMKKFLGNRILMHNNILTSVNIPSIPLLQLVRGFAKPVEKPAKVTITINLLIFFLMIIIIG
jgi:hypothetical protein